MSKTFLERKNPNGPYLFISYSHAEKEEVCKLLTALNEIGADFWYDKKLRGGDKWFEKVKEITANKNCIGIIYMLSADFIFSKSCLKEFRLLDELKKTHENFHEYYILMDDEEPKNFNAFMKGVRHKLLDKCDDEDEDEIMSRTKEYKDRFDQQIIYRMTAKGNIDSDGFVRTVYDDAFAAWGCSSEENGKINTLVEDGYIDNNYRVKTDCAILTGKVHRREVEWRVFAYNGNTLSAILVSDELYAATCRSLAKNELAEINRLINVLEKDKATDTDRNEKHFEFDSEFLKCLNPDAMGNNIRFLRATEHEKNYLLLKEALEKVHIAEAPDDGYFFAVDNQYNVLFADRGSSDIYRHIHIDAYASILPVIDIDLNKYKAYLANKK